MSTKPVRILMVCLGNICRSPTAEVVFRCQVQQRGLEHLLEVDSAGTSDWHTGEAPDSRAITHAEKRGYDLKPLRARQFSPEDAESFQYILAMDEDNLRTMLQCTKPELHTKFSLLLSYGDSEIREVPDPYHSGAAGFEEVLDLVETACSNLLDSIVDEQQLDTVQE